MTAGGSALLVVIGGGAAGIAALTKDKPPQVVTATGRESAAGVGAAPADDPAGPPAATTGKTTLKAPTAALGRRQVAEEADRTATRAPRPAAPAAVPAKAAPVPPEVSKQTVTETRAIPFRTRLISDPSMPRGTRRVQTEGIAGEETLRYLVTYVGGQEKTRQLLGTAVTREPQHRVIAFGSQGGPRGPGGPGGPMGPGHHRECGPTLSGCLPIGRSACPREDQVEESGAVPMGGSLDVLDQDLSTIDPSLLDGLELDPSMTC
jgi:hypothetical protein